jgi:hypothetical protein
VKSFQLDENANHRGLADTCNADGKCLVKRLPSRLVNQKDPIVLNDLLNKDATLLTMDFNIVREHPDCIPFQNPGVIVIRARPNSANRLMAMLNKFKTKCPNWPSFQWDQIYFEIHEAAVYVSGLTDAKIDNGKLIPYSTSDFETTLTEALNGFRQAANF